VTGEAGAGGDERTWVLTGERPDVVERVLVGGLLVAVWAPIEGALIRYAVVVPDEVSDLPLLSLLLALLAVWSYPAYPVLRHVTNGNRRGRVVTADRHGIHSERVTRRGRRPAASVAWSDIGSVDAGPNHLRIEGSAGETVLSRDASGPHQAIAEHITTRIAPPEGRPRLPVVRGFTAYLDDRGPTIISRRENRRRGAWWCGGIAAVLWADTAAAATDLDGLWALVGILGTAAAALTAAAVRFARTTPRWTAVPGAVVRIDKPGGEARFRATTLELAERTVEDSGVVSTELFAVDGHSRVSMVYGPADGTSVAETARWLAGAAGIPFRDLRPQDTETPR
jgi:hypothetical protein